MEGYGACYRKIVRDINTLLACVKKAAELARTGPAETHARMQSKRGQDVTAVMQTRHQPRGPVA